MDYLQKNKINKFGIDRFKILLSLFILFMATNTLIAQSTWSFDLNFGAATNIPLPLKIKQQGYPDIKLNANYYSEPFTSPVYWDWRFSKSKNERSWEFEAIHHKLFLKNKPDEVQQFSISHGFNLLFINRGFKHKWLNLKAGAGIVLSHPENCIRKQAYNENKGLFELGYHISGPAINFAIGKHFRLSKRFFINTEAKTTYAFAQIPISNGHANVNNWAFHFAVGLGFDFIKK